MPKNGWMSCQYKSPNISFFFVEGKQYGFFVLGLCNRFYIIYVHM